MVPVCVDGTMVAEVISGWTGIPVGKMMTDELHTVLNLKEKLAERVVGQDDALDAISRRIRTFHADLDDPGKPVGVFMLRRERYRAGLLDGEVVDYAPGGGVAQSSTYVANVLHGPLRRFWPNGQLMEEIAYLQGKPYGNARRFDQAGREIVETAASPGFMKSLEKLVRGG